MRLRTEMLEDETVRTRFVRDLDERVECRHIHRRCIGLDEEIERSYLLVPRWQHDVLLCQRVRYVLRGQPVRQQLVLVKIHLDVVRRSSIGCRDSSARNRWRHSQTAMISAGIGPAIWLSS